MSDDVPVIDLSAADEAALAAAVGAASARWGFFQVSGHGIPDTLIERVWAEARAFFALPMAEKRAVARAPRTTRAATSTGS